MHPRPVTSLLSLGVVLAAAVAVTLAAPPLPAAAGACPGAGPGAATYTTDFGRR